MKFIESARYNVDTEDGLKKLYACEKRMRKKYKNVVACEIILLGLTFDYFKCWDKKED